VSLFSVSLVLCILRRRPVALKAIYCDHEAPSFWLLQPIPRLLCGIAHSAHVCTWSCWTHVHAVGRIIRACAVFGRTRFLGKLKASRNLENANPARNRLEHPNYAASAWFVIR
jgi:hypothetical protein